MTPRRAIVGFILGTAFAFMAGYMTHHPTPAPPVPPPAAPIPASDLTITGRCSTLDDAPPERRCGPVDPDTLARWRRLDLADRRNEAARDLERAYRAALAREGLVPRTSHERP